MLNQVATPPIQEIELDFPLKGVYDRANHLWKKKGNDGDIPLNKVHPVLVFLGEGHAKHDIRFHDFKLKYKVDGFNAWSKGTSSTDEDYSVTGS